MTSYFTGLTGLWLLTDGLYSILTYPGENWWRNHSFRIIRMALGIVLIVMGMP